MEELHRTYYDYVVSLVRQAGIEEDSKEDVASAILLRFYERDFLAKFNPDLVFMYNGEERKARFKSFLTKFVLVYARGFREKQTRRNSREFLLSFNNPPGHITQWTSSDSDFWCDYFAEQTVWMEDVIIDGIVNSTLVADLRAYLAALPRRCKNDMCDLVALFDAIVDQFNENGTCDTDSLRQKFGVSPTTIHSWLWWLRENVAAHLGRRLRSKRSRPIAA